MFLMMTEYKEFIIRRFTPMNADKKYNIFKEKELKNIWNRECTRIHANKRVEFEQKATKAGK